MLEVDKWLKSKDNKMKINLSQCHNFIVPLKRVKDHGKEIDRLLELDLELVLMLDLEQDQAPEDHQVLED
jgi:hypothetical protein